MKQKQNLKEIVSQHSKALLSLLKISHILSLLSLSSLCLLTHTHTQTLSFSVYEMKRSNVSSGHRRAASDGASMAVAEAAAAEAAVPFLLQPEDEEDAVAESVARRAAEELEGREAQEGEDAEEEEGEVLSQSHSECDSATDYAAGDGVTAVSPFVSRA
jgi:hypothetical protein